MLTALTAQATVDVAWMRARCAAARRRRVVLTLNVLDTMSDVMMMTDDDRVSVANRDLHLRVARDDSVDGVRVARVNAVHVVRRVDRR